MGCGCGQAGVGGSVGLGFFGDGCRRAGAVRVHYFLLIVRECESGWADEYANSFLELYFF